MCIEELPSNAKVGKKIHAGLHCTGEGLGT